VIYFINSAKSWVHVQSVYQNGHIEVRIVAAKTRVSPMEKKPRLELFGAVLLSRFTAAISEAISNNLLDRLHHHDVLD